MNRTKLLTIAVIGLLVLNLGMLSMLFFAKSGHPLHLPPGQGEGPKKIIIERLHFDEQQQQKYEVLVKDHMNKTQELHKASRSMHDELFSILKADFVNKIKADSIILSISDNQKAIEQLNFTHFQEIKKLCKPEQIKEFKVLVDELGELFAPKGHHPH